jgi:hypothetical protein
VSGIKSEIKAANLKESASLLLKDNLLLEIREIKAGPFVDDTDVPVRTHVIKASSFNIFCDRRE